MIRSVTVYEIECDGCGGEISAPRAQDYWSSLDDARTEADLNGCTLTDDKALCWRCTEQEAA